MHGDNAYESPITSPILAYQRRRSNVYDPKVEFVDLGRRLSPYQLTEALIQLANACLSASHIGRIVYRLIEDEKERLDKSPTLKSNADDDLVNLELNSLGQQLAKMIPRMHHIVSALLEGRTIGDPMAKHTSTCCDVDKDWMNTSCEDKLAPISCRSTTILSSICFLRQNRHSKVATWATLALYGAGLRGDGFGILNKMGVTLAESTVYEKIKFLSKAQEKKLPDSYKEYQFVEIIDNVNFYSRKAQRRINNQNAQLNYTLAAIAPISNMPPEDLPKTSKPLRDLENYDTSSLLPSEEDDLFLKSRLRQRLINHAVTRIRPFQHLKHRQKDSQYPFDKITKTDIIPLPIIFENEAEVSGMIKVVESVGKNLNIAKECHGPRRIVGDLLTVEQVRRAKNSRIVQDESDPRDTLSNIHADAQELHLLMAAMDGFLHSYWGNVNDSCTLSFFSKLLRRGVNLDDSGAKYFNNGDEFLQHVFKAYLDAMFCKELRLSSIDGVLTTSLDLDDVVDRIMRQYFNETSTELAELDEKSVDEPFAYACQLVSSLFLYDELHDAVRHADGERILLMWRYLTVLFCACGKTKYASEGCRFQMTLDAVVSPFLRYLIVHNRGINTTGKKGGHKSFDWALEHFVREFKMCLDGMSSSAKQAWLLIMSLACHAINDIKRSALVQLGVPRNSSHHHDKDPEKDIAVLVTEILDSEILCTDSGRGRMFENGTAAKNLYRNGTTQLLKTAEAVKRRMILERMNEQITQDKLELRDRIARMYADEADVSEDDDETNNDDVGIVTWEVVFDSFGDLANETGSESNDS